MDNTPPRIAEKARVLVVDDDQGLRDLLLDYLKREGFEVAGVEDGEQMFRWLDTESADIIILDLMLPGEDGLSLARRLRQSHSTPIIMLSARGDDVDRIVGLEVGADDYLSKPFNPRELLARIRAVLRRHSPAAEEPQATPGDSRSFGPYQLNIPMRQLERAGEPISLTPGEFDLLRVFCEHPNRLLDRDRLLDLLKGYERNPFDRSIDVQVARLRAKIEHEKKNPRYIRTVWGRGYIFTPQGQP
ncbi:response regulator [Thiorhodovibrio frisius]|uniref:Response regulator with CheY-like receiver domain and winged-helix DNA-binding domain n=1 Tax=Thiorhodovibrio frisius TaxID=631362 RepID=H8Z3E9_9GAMM|nr:response regulator [Thiorhodovibrio frisius]EIC21857.1 response regulator with CheY-like receiver domain and winged-helix DNA-binding domain [Thiorhodovibrio frisius]WPL21825.1 Transcriptional regulatory protein OmpR [Thiorhodovibrio frisius]